MNNRPKVGVGVIIIKDNQVLLGQRKNAHGSGSWSFPGGHLEFNETLEACARREALEETGLRLKNIRAATFTNDIFAQEGRHYVTLYVTAEIAAGQLDLMEPEKCAQWAWFNWADLPHPLFIPIQNLLKQGYNPFDPGTLHLKQEP
jgi:8-oxo-dGTP diphosphatase